MLDFMAHIGYDQLEEVGATAPELLSALDANGVQAAVVSPIGDAWVHRFGERNREVAAIVREHSAAGGPTPDRAASERAARLLFFCTVNPWFGDAALEELARCVAVLGALGLALHPARQGFSIDAPLAAPLLEAARAARVPVYVYTGTPVYGLPLNVAAAARRYPDLPFVIGTMGASDYWGDVIPAARSAENIWVETSLNANVPALLRSLVKEIGADRVLFGSNFPYSSYRIEIEKLRACRLDDTASEKIFGVNARRLLGMERQR